MMRFLRGLDPDDSLTRRQVVFGLPWVIRNGLASQVMETLTIGPFLIAYALVFDASNVVIGLLAAIPFLTQFVQLPAVYLVERVRKRRLLSFVFAASSRPMMLVMALAAFMPSPATALAVLMAGLAGRYGLGAIVGCSWNSWMRDLIPEQSLGRFFARRLMLMTILGVALSLAGAAFVDQWAGWFPDRRVYAYSLLLVAGFVGGTYSVYCMVRIPEPRMPEAHDLRLGGRLAQPFRDANFRRLILFLGSWNFAVNLAAPFFTVYLFKRLDFNLTGVTLLVILSHVANVM